MTDTVQAISQQLQRLRSLHTSGALGDAQYAERSKPLERRLVDLLVDTAHAAPAEPVPPKRPGKLLWVALAGFTVLVAAAGYWWTGAPELIGEAPSGQAVQGRADGGAAPHSLDREQFGVMTERLAARLKDQPDDAAGWAMLGRSYMALERNEDALDAFAHAAKLRPDDASILADLADALALKNGRDLSGDPTRLIERALKIDPDNLKALTLAGTAAFNRGDFAKAAEYFDRAVKVGPPDSPIVQQARDAAAEARERGKLPTAATAVAAAAAPAASAAPTSTGSAGAISGTVSLAPALKGKVAPDDTVFVFARPAEGSRVPLAIVRKQVKDLPYTFRLDDSLAMSPAALVSTAGRVIVGARISKSGQAMPQPGDLEGLTQATAIGSSGVAVVIAAEVK